MRALAVLLLLTIAAPVSAADNQIRFFVGGSFGGGTGLVDWDHAAGNLHKSIGASVVSLGNVFGVEAEVADSPGFFQNSNSANLVLSSRVTTATGSIVIAAPRSKTEYGLRPYVVGGGGIIRTRITDYFGFFKEPIVLPAFTAGIGVMGFFTNRVGVSWELRRLESWSRQDDGAGRTIDGKLRLSFWRADMAFVYRY